jgi:hypothetical protein
MQRETLQPRLSSSYSRSDSDMLNPTIDRSKMRQNFEVFDLFAGQVLCQCFRIHT